MSMTIDENTVGIWYVETATGNWMATLYREEDRFCITGRIRIEVDHVMTIDSEDIKHWFDLHSPPGVSEISAIQNTRKLASQFGEYDEPLMEGKTVDEFLKAFASKPYTHMTVKQVEKQE